MTDSMSLRLAAARERYAAELDKRAAYERSLGSGDGRRAAENEAASVRKQARKLRGEANDGKKKK